MAQRLRGAFTGRAAVEKMFGGVCFMLDGHMCCGLAGERLMARVGPDQYESALALPHAMEMDFTGRPMKGMVLVDPAGIEDDKDLAFRVGMCSDFVSSLPPE